MLTTEHFYGEEELNDTWHKLIKALKYQCILCHLKGNMIQ